MAKIGARGATEVARVNATTEGGHTLILVQCSDGRVLRRYTGDAGTGYNVLRKVRPEATNIDTLRRICEFHGWQITKEKKA